MPTVFISYRHESEDHGSAVHAFATALRLAGAEVIFDQFVQTEVFRMGGPDGAWPEWCAQQAREADFVLAIQSQGWFDAWTRKAAPGVGRGCAAETRVLHDRLYDNQQKNDFLRWIELKGQPVVTAPHGIVGYHAFAWPERQDEIITWLGLPTTAPCWPTSPPTFTWSRIANHQAARSAATDLLRDGPARLLRIQAEGAHGKSKLLDEIVTNARTQDWLRCGRLDLAEPAREREAVDHLCHGLGLDPPPGDNAATRLSAVLRALNRRGHPSLLVVDAFEKASPDTQAWFEKTLPALVENDVATRLVVAGREVPSHISFRGGLDVAPLRRLKVPTVDDWFEFAYAQNPHLQELDPTTARTRFQETIGGMVAMSGQSGLAAVLLPALAASAAGWRP